MNTSSKIPLFLCAALIFSWGCLRSSNFAQAKNIVVNPADQTCQTDEDCKIIQTLCSTCECGQPINKVHEKEYVEAIKKLCQDYHGPVCEYNCSTPFARCRDQRCILSPS